MFKIFKGFEDTDAELFFLKSDLSLRGHELKLVKHRARLDVRKYFSVIELLTNGIVCLKKLYSVIQY